MSEYKSLSGSFAEDLFIDLFADTFGVEKAGYRVLLTRARSGMVICVPEGNPNKTLNGFWENSTRLPEYYDGTYQYLKSLGIEEI